MHRWNYTCESCNAGTLRQVDLDAGLDGPVAQRAINKAAGATEPKGDVSKKKKLPKQQRQLVVDSDYEDSLSSDDIPLNARKPALTGEHAAIQRLSCC